MFGCGEVATWEEQRDWDEVSWWRLEKVAIIWVSVWCRPICTPNLRLTASGAEFGDYLRLLTLSS